MSVNAKVHGGTRPGGNTTLCSTCSHGMMIRGDCEGQDVMKCDYVSGQLRMRVTECSRYYDKTHPSLNDLYNIAWVLETSKNRRNIGFVPWKEYKEKHKDEDNSIPMGF